METNKRTLQSFTFSRKWNGWRERKERERANNNNNNHANNNNNSNSEQLVPS